MNVEQRISDEKYTKGRELTRSYKDRSVHLLTQMTTPNGSVLDIGCGTGMNSKKISDCGFKVTGIDVSPVAIERYREAGFEGQVADITAAPPFAPESFDSVYASEVIEHIADTEMMLQNASSLLKPGGLLVLTTPNSAFWAYRIMALIGQTLSTVQHPGHLRFFTGQSLKKAIEHAGFSDISIQGRNMYCIIPGGVADPLLERCGFTREQRFATKKHFYQLSALRPKASGLWTDTFIITARKAS